MEMTYKEAVKLIHPDVCKVRIDNIGENMAKLKDVRNTPTDIYRYMAAWGLVDCPKHENKTEEETLHWRKIYLYRNMNYRYYGCPVFVKMNIKGKFMFFKVIRTTRERIYVEPIKEYKKKTVNFSDLVMAAKLSK